MRSRIDIIGSNGNDGLHYGWKKHDGSKESPVSKDTTIEVETWVATGNTLAKASELNWSAVKFYREVEEKVRVEPPSKSFSVLADDQIYPTDGYQAASQKAIDLYKLGKEPTIEIRYSKPLNGTT